MSMDKFLSQDEVDALLKGLSDGELEADTEETAGSANVRSYDFTSQDRIIRGRMPTMEIINERFARVATASLFRFLGKMSDVALERFELVKYGEFVRKLPVPSSLNLFRLDPFRGLCLFFFDAKLIFLIVDVLFGGRGKSNAKVEGRDFTAIEYRIIRRLLDMFLQDLQKAWSLLGQVTPNYVRAELNPQFANIAAPTDIVLSSVFQVEMEWNRGFMGCCIPYSTVEPIKDNLYGRFQSEYAEIDQTWKSRILEHIQSFPMEIRVELGESKMSLGQLLSLNVGDVIRTNVSARNPQVLKIQKRPKALCRTGVMNGSYAAEIVALNLEKNKESPLGTSALTQQEPFLERALGAEPAVSPNG